MHYGRNTVIYGPLSAPTLFTGDKMSFTARDAVTDQLITDGAENNVALALHSHKVSLDWEVQIRSTSTDFLDLSAGAKLAVTGYSISPRLTR